MLVFSALTLESFGVKDLSLLCCSLVRAALNCHNVPIKFSNAANL